MKMLDWCLPKLTTIEMRKKFIYLKFIPSFEAYYTFSKHLIEPNFDAYIIRYGIHFAGIFQKSINGSN